MTDAADRVVWEADEEALYRATRATEPASQPQGAPEGIPGRQGAREARYAEALKRSPNGPWMTLPGPTDIALSFVRAVLPLVDAEVAAAVSEAQAERDAARECVTVLSGQIRWEWERLARMTRIARSRGEDRTAQVERTTTGEAITYVDKETHEPCPTLGNRLCSITDPSHRHVAAHMLPAPVSSGEAGMGEADVVRVLQRFADHDLHGLIPHSEISNAWYHRGIDAAQREASEWAERIGTGEVAR